MLESQQRDEEPEGCETGRERLHLQSVQNRPACLGGVRRLAMAVTQVSVGSQGSLLGGAQTDRRAGQMQSSPQLSPLLGMEEALSICAGLPRLQTPASAPFPDPHVPKPSLFNSLLRSWHRVESPRSLPLGRAPECLCHREKGIIMIGPLPSGRHWKNPEPLQSSPSLASSVS